MGVDTVFWDPYVLYGDNDPDDAAAIKPVKTPISTPQPEVGIGIGIGPPGLTMSRRRGPAPVEEPKLEVEKPYDATFRLKPYSAARSIKFSLDDV